MKFAAVVVLALLLLPTVAIAGPLEDGMAAMDRADYHGALVIFQPMAYQGNARAQYWVGVLYQDGQMDKHGQWTMKRDYAEAAKWYRKAADQGYADAQESLSEMYLFGEGVKKDWVEAYFWSMLAAAPAGNRDASESGASIAARLTPEQKASVKKRLKEWKPTSSQHPVPESVTGKPETK